MTPRHGLVVATEALNNILSLGEDITVFEITGGPCSGKTSGIARLMRMLADRGYKVLVSPETATKLISAGMTPGELPWVEFQTEILLDTLSQESRIFSIAKRYRDAGRKVVILCDRGTMDGEAYVGAETFSSIIGSLWLTHRELCNDRYHAVMHLRTAALGAEKFYTLENNTARIETPEEARSLDQRTLEAWQRHQHPRVIDNSTDFEGKLRRLLAEVCEVLGDPIPLEKEDKFLIEPFDPATLPVKWTDSHITQDYLMSPIISEERRVRSRADADGTSYYYTVKREVSPGIRAEEERAITKREYDSLRTLRQRGMLTILKRRVCFFYREQFFEVDLFESPAKDLALMEAERSDRTPVLELPPFIKVIRDVTGEKKYSNKEIARGMRVG